MDVSQKRIEANRRNATKSTGPKSIKGKEIARKNALKHGLCAEVLGHPEDRAAEGAAPLDMRAWVDGQVGMLAGRLDRLDRMEREERKRVVARAGTHWEEDRRGEAEALGARIHRDPAAVVDKLRQTPQGCEWLATRWAMLARVADRDGRWDPGQVALAFDLTGTPLAFRGGEPGEMINADGTVADPGADRLALARASADELLARRDGLAESDDFDRSLAKADLTDDASPLLRRLRRYESAIYRRLRWCLEQLAGKPGGRSARPEDRSPDRAAPASIRGGGGPGAAESGDATRSGPRPAETPAAQDSEGLKGCDPGLGDRLPATASVPLSIGVAPLPDLAARRHRPDPAALRAELRREAKRDRRERLRA